MKKILLAILCLIGGSAVMSAKAPVNFGDSLAYTVGEAEGAYARTFAGKKAGADSLAFLKSYGQAFSDLYKLPVNDKYYMEGLVRAINLLNMLNQMKGEGLAVELDMLGDGYQYGVNLPAQTPDSVRAYDGKLRGLMERASAQVKAIKEAQAKEQLDENVRAGNAYVENLKKADKKIVTTPSGLSYKVVKKGKKGATPTDGDKVKVHYTGKLIDGTVFDSSVERGEPAVFPVDRVVKGFGEGLKLMTPGSKYTFYIPFNLAYGNRGTGDGSIPPGATLTFDVELLEINPTE